MQGHHVMRDYSAASYEELSEILNLARLTEYSISFLVTMLVSLVVIFKVRCQLQNFSYYIMGILMCS
jgi:cell division protein FtsX